MLVRLLSRGHWRSRWRRYTLLAVAFGLGLLSFMLVLTVLDGARVSLTQPLAATITGPLRVTNQTSDLGAGAAWDDLRPVQARLQQLTGGTVVARYESSYITIRERDYDNWSAGLLVGIDPARDALVADHSRYIIWGRPITTDLVYAPDGKAWAPLVLGEAAAKRLNLSLPEDGSPDFANPLTLTSGHSYVQGSLPVPIVTEAVVVGIFETGLEPLDKFTAFIPITQARFLAGIPQQDAVANAFLIDAPDEAGSARRIRAELGYEAQTSQESAFNYMGSTLVVLYVAAGLGIALFLIVLVIWLMHETGSFVRADQPIICTLRGIGVPVAAMQSSYVGLTTLAVTAGTLGAFLVALVVLPFLPPLEWRLSGLTAQIELVPNVRWILGLVVLICLVAALSAYVAARRVAGLDILEGLRRA